jgi:hypothetical protein
MTLIVPFLVRGFIKLRKKLLFIFIIWIFAVTYFRIYEFKRSIDNFEELKM